MKSDRTKKLIAEAITILDSVGIPILKQTARKQERIAMAFMAVAGITASWKEAKSLRDGRKPKTREIIAFMNEHYNANISSGSYDDVRRDHLKSLVLAELVINSADNPNAPQNSPNRGYSLESDFKDLVRTFNTKSWDSNVAKFVRLKGSLEEKIARKRDVPKMHVTLPSGKAIRLKENYHNALQRAIVEDFLPNFGQGCQLLYIGDTSNRIIVHERDVLSRLGFFELGTDTLPDVIAFNESNNWLYLIEAVTSSGPMSEERVYEIKKMSSKCTADLIFVTAFLNRVDFRKWVEKIAWETEVWIADNPEHMIHFNGDKFLGPHARPKL